MTRSLGSRYDDPGQPRGSSYGTSYAEPRRWQVEAACRDADPRLFWPETSALQAARNLCAVCPVIVECFTDAIIKRDYGSDAVFRAGMTGPQRERAKQGQPISRVCESCGGNFVAIGFARLCSDICRLRAKRNATRRWRSA